MINSQQHRHEFYRRLARKALPAAGLALGAVAGVLLASSQIRAGSQTDGEDTSSSPEQAASRWNIGMNTLGGRMLWGDVHFFHDWRIQHHIMTGHYRLLDGNDVRHSWGTFDQCLQRLNEIRRERNLPDMSGKAVVLVHGIIRSSKSFGPMAQALRDAGYQVFAFDYPSTHVEIEASATYLNRALSSLEGIEEINFVVHSMGGLVVRASLAERDDPRFHRMVMLGVPNQGARLANLVKENVLYRVVYGPAGQQLAEDPAGFVARLPTPSFEFAIIAGGRGTLDGYNPLIPGDDDGTISVACTRLPGAADFATFPALHSFLMKNGDIIAAGERFLRTGALREEGPRQPIPADPEMSRVSETATQE